MNSPYQDLPASAFWRAAVADRHPQDMDGLYIAKFAIQKSDRIMTAGSCFAQHLGRHLTRSGCNVIDKERAPVGLSDEDALRFGYNQYSCRYGNIYTSRQLLQLLQEAAGKAWKDIEGWEKDGKWYDPQRPSVEPFGLGSLEELKAHRRQHLRRVRRALAEAQVFVFTFGLTETWVNKETGRVYPTAPGTIAGNYQPEKFQFLNLRYGEIYEDMRRSVELLQEFNKGIRVITTVSPVPLTATASGAHVLPATSYSKGVLRSVAGDLASDFECIDYFPSYEIITSPSSRGYYFEPNLRSVNRSGVEQVMSVFSGAHGISTKEIAPGNDEVTSSENSAEDVICEEILLDAFSK